MKNDIRLGTPSINLSDLCALVYVNAFITNGNHTGWAVLPEKAYKFAQEMLDERHKVELTQKMTKW